MVQHNTIDHTGVPGVGGSVATDTIWNAAGDLAVGTGSDTAARLAIGTAGEVLISNGTTASWGPDFADFTPALTAATSNPTLGSGSSVAGRYVRVGALVVGKGAITFGTSGAAAGTGNYRVSLPVNAAAPGAGTILGQGFITDDSTGAQRGCVLVYVSTSTAALFTIDGSAAVSNAAPWTWTNNDNIRYSFEYEAA